MERKKRRIDRNNRRDWRNDKFYEKEIWRKGENEDNKEEKRNYGKKDERNRNGLRKCRERENRRKYWRRDDLCRGRKRNMGKIWDLK